MNGISWLTNRDQELIGRWIEGEKFVLICEGGSTALDEIRELLPNGLVELNRKQFSQRMGRPPESPCIYLIYSIPSKIQQSRLSCWLNRPGNRLVIFVEKFNRSELNWKDKSGSPIAHQVISGPYREEDD